MKLPLTALILTTALLTACVPIHVDWTDWPTVDGRALDAMTGKPIAGAAVTVRASGADFSDSTVTAADGTFHFARRTHQQWTPSNPYEVVFPPPVITVTAPAHEPFAHKLDGTMSPEAILLAPSR